MQDSFTGPWPLGTCPIPDDMPEGATPIYMGIRDRPTHCIGWVTDPSMATLASLLRQVADEVEGLE